MDTKLDDRLATLESKIAFQDRTIEELNSVLIQQQTQINDLIRRLRDLAKQVGTPPIAKDGSETPPHY